MKFTDICFITENVQRLARFYETVFQTKAEGDDMHSSLTTNGAVIAIYSKKAAETDMSFDFAKYWGSGNFTIGYNVDDVDGEYERLKSLNVDFETIPTTWPWGARSVHFRDPDGNIICFKSFPKQ
jgi:catechol 2,3-dioxygenase-like lactoylglutathione lyase family enzyme